MRYILMLGMVIMMCSAKSSLNPTYLPGDERWELMVMTKAEVEMKIIKMTPTGDMLMMRYIDRMPYKYQKQFYHEVAHRKDLLRQMLKEES